MRKISLEDSITVDKMTKVEEVTDQPVEITLDEAHKRVAALNKEWEESVRVHEAKNEEMMKHAEVTNTLHDALPEDKRELLLSERNKIFEIKVNERYMLLVNAYKKLYSLSALTINVKDEQFKTYNGVLEKIRDDANNCADCPCKKYFEKC